VAAAGGEVALRQGDQMWIDGIDDPQYDVGPLDQRDSWDNWVAGRESRYARISSYSYVNYNIEGIDQLEDYGRWVDVPAYGRCWTPSRVEFGWQPYRSGRWIWQDPWGWTWIGDEPWGWAPYHYGRWFMYENSWVWWPGQSYGYRSYYRPVWAPAYVSFFGFDSGFSAGFSFGGGFGSVGWLPIGPCDGYYPWWGGYRSRFNSVNITNITNVNNYYGRNGGIPPLRSGTRYSNLRLAVANDRMRMAVSTVNANDFGRGRFTARPVSNEMFRNGRLVAGNLPVVPNRESLLAGQRRAAPPTIGRGGQPERFFSNNRNRQVQTARSFDREAADVRSSIQRDGRFPPIVGNQRSNAGEGNARSLTQGRDGQNRGLQNPGFSKPAAGVPSGRSNQGSSQGANQTWRRLGPPVQRPNGSGAGTGLSNPGQRGQAGGGTPDWRRSPKAGAPRGSVGNGSVNNSNPAGRVNAPVDRPGSSSTPRNNQDWRRLDRPSSPAPRSSGGLTEAPASRDRSQRGGSIPTQDRGSDWRRMPAQRPMDAPVNRSQGRGQGNDTLNRFPSRNSAPQAQRDPGNWRQPAPQTQRDPGNWRQPAPRSNGRESRPQLDMRQPIVTPRPSNPAPRGNYGKGGYSGPRSAPSGGAYSAPRGGGYSAPSGGGYSSPNRGGGGGYSAPRGGGGGYSAPRGGGGGGGQHSSGANNAPHRGR